MHAGTVLAGLSVTLAAALAFGGKALRASAKTALILILPFGANSSFAAETFSLGSLLEYLKGNRPSFCVDYYESSIGKLRDSPDALYVASVCALRANRPILAQTLVTKLLAQSPDYPGAWFIKAQADYIVRDNDSLSVSRRALEAAPLAPEQQKPARNWLDELRQSETNTEAAIDVELGAGYTTNANAGTNESEYFGTPIPPALKQTASEFSDATFGVRGSKAVGQLRHVAAMAQVSRRANVDATFANQTVISGAIAYQAPRGRTTLDYSLRGFSEYVNGTPQRIFASINVLASRRVSDRTEITGGLRAGRLNYRISTRPDLNVWRALWQLDVVRLSGRSLDNRLGIGILGGGDEEVIFRSSFGNSKIGMRLFADTNVGKHIQLRGDASWAQVEFDVPGGFTGITRSDRQLAFGLSATWRASKASRWSIESRLTNRQLASNVRAYSFSQSSAGVWIHYTGT